MDVGIGDGLTVGNAGFEIFRLIRSEMLTPEQFLATLRVAKRLIELKLS